MIYWVVAVIGILFISGCVEQGTQVQNTPISASDLAKCLAANGAKVYGASSCSHCQDQKALFGEDWKFINYIECEVPEDPNAQKDECMRAGITAYPTWVFKDGQVKQGLASMDELVQMSGCKSPIAAPSVPIVDEELPDAQTGTETIIEQTTVEDAAKSKEESMTYQIDLDSYYTHNGDHSSNTEHVVFSTQKTLIRKSNYKFESEYGESTPLKVSVEGYYDQACAVGGDVSNIRYIRGIYSGSYDGAIEVDMEYLNEEYVNPEDQGVGITFSQIRGLPTTPPAKRLICPTESEVSEEVLNRQLHGLYAATDTIYNRIDEVNYPERYGPFFKSIDGGTIDFSGTVESTTVGYTNTWVGTLTVKRIS